MSTVDLIKEPLLPSGSPAVPESERPGVENIEQHPSWPVLSRMPVPVSAQIPISRFKVCHLLALQQGQIIETTWPETEGVPLIAAKVQVGWGEFEVAEQRLMVRLTRLA